MEKKKLEKEKKKVEREKRKAEKVKEKEEKRLMREAKKQERSKQQLDLAPEFDKLTLNGGTISDTGSDAGSDATCPICGMHYGDRDSVMWICCDKCDQWFDFGCAMISEDNIPDNFFCKVCMGENN